MITRPAKVFLPLTVLGLFAAAVYTGITGDQAGVVMFIGVALAALFAAVSVTVARDNDFAPVVADDAPPPAFSPAPPARLPGGPLWPAAGALAIGFVVLSLAGGPRFAVPGVALAAVAGVGWLGSLASDRTGRVINMLPIGIPVMGLTFIFSLMFFLSRMLLAVPEAASTFVALGAAIAILAVATVFAVKPQIKARTIMVGMTIGAVVFVGGGLTAAAYGQRSVEKKGIQTATVDLRAHNVSFNLKVIDFPANRPVEIKFSNADSVPHNVAIYANADYSGQALFQGPVAIGGGSATYQPNPLAAGTYYFRCDIHPTVMTGKVVVS